VTLTLNAYTHVVSAARGAVDGILHSTAPKKENGSGLEHPKPLYLN
jgi:hypothetical protein